MQQTPGMCINARTKQNAADSHIVCVHSVDFSVFATDPGQFPRVHESADGVFSANLQIRNVQHINFYFQMFADLFLRYSHW